MTPRSAETGLVVSPGNNLDDIVQPTHEFCSRLAPHLKRALNMLIGAELTEAGRWGQPRTADEIIAQRQWTIRDLEIAAADADMTGSFRAMRSSTNQAVLQRRTESNTGVRL